MPTAIETAAHWAATLDLKAIPSEAVGIARNCLIDTIGVALAGSRTAVSRRVASVVAATYGSGESTALCGVDRLQPAGAAWVNGTAAHALDFDDNCYAGFVHGSAVVVPAGLAAAEVGNLSGADLLTAIVAGIEAECAVGKALGAHIYEKGWWTTGVLGPIGAAIAAARAQRLTAQHIGCAMGIATAGSGGAKACFGTDSKPALCGRASEAGVIAASMAAAGVTGPLDAFENHRGFAHLFNDGTWDPSIFERLGRTWSLLEPGIDVKRIPICLSAHAAVDALIELIAENRLTTAEIAKIVCDVPVVVVNNLVYARPGTPQEAQFSLPFAMASVLVNGDVGLAQLEPAAVADPRLGEVMDRVEMTTSLRWGPERARQYPEGAFVALALRDGRRFEKFCGSARGTTAQPLSEADLSAKFMTCASQAIDERKAGRLLSRLREIEKLGSARLILQGPD